MYGLRTISNQTVSSLLSGMANRTHLVCYCLPNGRGCVKSSHSGTFILFATKLHCTLEIYAFNTMGFHFHFEILGRLLKKIRDRCNGCDSFLTSPLRLSSFLFLVFLVCVSSFIFPIINQFGIEIHPSFIHLFNN